VSHVDVARFLSIDPDALVWASFACPYCLDYPEQLALIGDTHSRAVACVCGACEQHYSVGLSEAQTLRLALAPPPNLWFEQSLGSISRKLTVTGVN